MLFNSDKKKSSLKIKIKIQRYRHYNHFNTCMNVCKCKNAWDIPPSSLSSNYNFLKFY